MLSTGENIRDRNNVPVKAVVSPGVFRSQPGSNKSETNTSLNDDSGKGRSSELPCYLFLVGLVVAVFAKTIFLAQPISKICRLAEWDTIFSSMRTGISSFADPSIVQLLVPSYFLVAHGWHQGSIPLWNSFNALGCPLIGDIQATIFSPVRLIFNIWPTMYTYNLTLVIEVLVSALGSFALARTLGLGRLASVMTSLTYAFCPFNMWYLELLSGASHCLFPLVFCAFSRLALRPSSGRAYLAGASCALLILSGHPESAFFGILFASLFFAVLMHAKNMNNSLSLSLGRSFKYLSVAAVVAFCLSAPVLLPFLEYLTNSDCYKFAIGLSAFVPWQTLVYNLMQPGFTGASPFIGIVPAAFFVYSLIRLLPQAFKPEAKMNMAVQELSRLEIRALVPSFVCLAIGFLLMSRLGPIDAFLRVPPLTYLITVYVLPVFLLMASLMASIGFDCFIQEWQAKNGINSQNETESVRCVPRAKTGSMLALVAGLAICLFLPLSLWITKVPLTAGDFDMMLPHMSFNYNHFKVDAVLSGILLFAVLLSSYISYVRIKLDSSNLMRGLVPIMCVVATFISIMTVSKTSLPIEQKFNYKKVEVVDYLQKMPERTATFGNHLFKPNTNAVYGIASLQTHNPLFPKRYVQFMQACGARLDEFNQELSGTVSPLLSIASTKFLLALEPLRMQGESIKDREGVIVLKPSVQSFAAGQLASVTEAYYDPFLQEIHGRLKFDFVTRELETKMPGTKTLDKYSFALVLTNDQGQPLWFSDQKALAPSYSFSVPVSLQLQAGKQANLELQIFDKKKGQFLSKEPKRMASFAVKLGSRPSVPRPFELRLETSDRIRIYDNVLALPRMYTVFNVVPAKNAQEALQSIQSNNFNPHGQAVVEFSGVLPGATSSEELTGQEYKTLSEFSSNRMPPGVESVSFTRPCAERITATVDSIYDRYLVLTESYYPGWKAYIDGKAVSILRTNFLFKGIVLPKGKHTVEFAYQPASFTWGLWLLGMGLALAIFINLRKGFRYSAATLDGNLRRELKDDYVS